MIRAEKWRQKHPKRGGFGRRLPKEPLLSAGLQGYSHAFCVDCRQQEELHLQLTEANERAAQLQKDMEQITSKAEERQQDAQKNHQAELKKLQDKLSSLVRSTVGKLVGFIGRRFPRIVWISLYDCNCTNYEHEE